MAQQNGGGINLDRFQQRQPKLSAADINGDVIVLTIAATRILRDLPDTENGGTRDALMVTFAEYPEHVYWPNYTSLKRLVEQLGASDTDWVGQRVPLCKVKSNNPVTGKATENLWVCPTEEWDDHFAGSARAVKRASKSASKRTGETGAKKAAKRGGRK